MPECVGEIGADSDNRIGVVLAEDDFQFVAPVLAESNELPLDLGRKIAKYRQICRVNAQRRSGEKKTRRSIRDFDAGEIAFALERG